MFRLLIAAAVLASASPRLHAQASPSVVVRLSLDSTALPSWISELGPNDRLRARTAYLDLVWSRATIVNELLQGVFPPGETFWVRHRRCNEPDYAYVHADSSILICSNFDDLVSSAPTLPNPEHAGLRSSGESFLIFALLHEIGHAVIARQSIPVLGRLEDAADGFATFVLTRDDVADRILIAVGAAHFFDSWQALRDNRLSVEQASQDLSGQHGLPGQRAARLHCAIYSRVVPNGSSCEAEWESQSASWELALARHRARVREAANDRP